MKKTLFIVGGASTSLEIRETVETYFKENFEQVYSVIGDNENIHLDGIIRDAQLSEVLASITDIGYIIGFTEQSLRKKFKEIFKSYNGEEVTIIHPRAFVAPSAKIGKGVYMAPNSVVSTNAVIEDSVIINMNTTVGHDAHIGSDTFLNPGARISGNVKIGSKTLIGAGAFIFQGLSVGNRCSIDALTYIDKDIEDRMLCTSRFGTLKITRNIFG